MPPGFADNPFQKPIENVALNSGRPHRFGPAYQRAFSERLKQAKSNNFKRSNFRQSVFFGAQMRSSKKVVEEGSRYW
jgi:hypothetical protein